MTVEQMKQDVDFIRSLYYQKDVKGLKEAMNTYEAIEIVHIFEELVPDERVIIYRFLHKDLALEVFEQLDPGVQEQLIESFSEVQAVHVIEEMETDDRVRLLDELPAKVADRLVMKLSPEERTKTALLRGYEIETAGRIMTPDYLSLKKDMTVTEAIEKVRTSEVDRDNLTTLYVTDESRFLIGIVDLQDLVIAKPDERIEDIMEDDIVFAGTGDDQEKVARMLQEHDLIAIPVVDRERRLVGAITIDDVVDIIEEEVTEDFHKIGAVGKFKIIFREATVPFLFRIRIGWLMVLVFMNIFSGAGIAYFEDTIEAVVALVFFLPLLIDSGGNAGAQSATMMVRALEVILVVALTMTLVVVVGSTLGMSLPFVLSRFNFDPAAASGPLITSLADIAGVLIYFSIATWYLGIG